MLTRELVRAQRLTSIRIIGDDRPGLLGLVSNIIGGLGANIVEVSHQRIFTDLPAKGLVTDIECEARDRTQLDKLVAALRAKGYAVSQVELN